MAGRDARDTRDGPVGTIVVVGVRELREIIRDEVQRVLAAHSERLDGRAVSEWIGDLEAAQMLGVTKDYLRKIPALPVHKVGRKRRYRRTEVDAFIATRAGAERGTPDSGRHHADRG